MAERRFSNIFSRILPRTGRRLMRRYEDGFSGGLPGLRIVTITEGSVVYMSKMNYCFSRWVFDYFVGYKIVAGRFPIGQFFYYPPYFSW